jgi:dipeptidase E
MKLLLTSFGLANATIVAALERLLGKPIGEATVMYVPTALHATPGGVAYAWRMLDAVRPADWADVGILELTALPDIPSDRWLPAGLKQLRSIVAELLVGLAKGLPGWRGPGHAG